MADLWRNWSDDAQDREPQFEASPVTGPRILFANCEARMTGPAATGFVAEAIDAGGGRIDWVDVHAGGSLPSDLSEYDGLVLPGGEMSVFDPKHGDLVSRLCDVYLDFQGAGKPVLGLCLGAQIMVRALGGRVERMDYTEFGFETVRTTAAAGQDPMFAAVIGEHRIFEAHRDRFEIPDGAIPMMVGTTEHNQVFRVDPLGYGFQCHFEVTRQLAEKWILMMERELLPWLGENGLERIARVRAELDEAMPRAEAFARSLMAGWMNYFEARDPTMSLRQERAR
jgi:GMP synthase (glutamine-hydrolysing)